MWMQTAKISTYLCVDTLLPVDNDEVLDVLLPVDEDVPDVLKNFVGDLYGT